MGPIPSSHVTVESLQIHNAMKHSIDNLNGYRAKVILLLNPIVRARNRNICGYPWLRAVMSNKAALPNIVSKHGSNW